MKTVYFDTYFIGDSDRYGKLGITVKEPLQDDVYYESNVSQQIFGLPAIYRNTPPDGQVNLTFGYFTDYPDWSDGSVTIPSHRNIFWNGIALQEFAEFNIKMAEAVQQYKDVAPQSQDGDLFSVLEKGESADGHKITQLADGEDDQDAATVKQAKRGFVEYFSRVNQQDADDPTITFETSFPSWKAVVPDQLEWTRDETGHYVLSGFGDYVGSGDVVHIGVTNCNGNDVQRIYRAYPSDGGLIEVLCYNLAGDLVDLNEFLINIKITKV